MINYKVLMLPQGHDNRFVGFDLLSDLGLKFDLTAYNRQYEGTIEGNGENIYQILEAIFIILNIDHPNDYKLPSLSVGDIVVIDNRHYFCDSVGFKEVVGNS